MLFVLIVVVLVVGVAVVLVIESWPTITTFGLSFLTNQAFDPVHNIYGVGPAIYGTLVTSAFAMLFAIPIGVGASIFVVDFCPRPLRIPHCLLYRFIGGGSQRDLWSLWIPPSGPLVTTNR